MSKCNSTLDDLRIHEVDLKIGITFHHLGLIVSAASGLVAVVVAGWLLLQHARHYSKPWEQKHIIRILFMIPVYAAVSFLSYYNYLHTIYYQVLRDCYEAFAIASFFSLLCSYLAPTLHDQKEYFRGIRNLKNWIWPLSWLQKCTGGRQRGWLRVPTSGLTWFNINWIAVFQYCFIRVFFTIVSVITEALDRYCEGSLSPAFAHIWVTVFEAASVTIAMYGLIQFYYQTKEDLAEHRPFLKILCIKLVIFFSFWQTLVISFLSSTRGPLQPSKYISYPDIRVGIPSMLLCLEMAMFAVLHLWAFPWRGPYGVGHDGGKQFNDPNQYKYASAPPTHYQGGSLGLRALGEAFNPWDIVKASARGFRWLFVGARYRRQDKSYQMSGDGSQAQTTSSGGPQNFDGYPEQDIPLKTQTYEPSGTAPYAYPPAQQTHYAGPYGYNTLGGGYEASESTQRGGARPEVRQDWPLSMPSNTYDNTQGLYNASNTWGPSELDEAASRTHEARYSFDKDSEDRAGLLKYAQRPSESSHAAEPPYRRE